MVRARPLVSRKYAFCFCEGAFREIEYLYALLLVCIYGSFTSRSVHAPAPSMWPLFQMPVILYSSLYVAMLKTYDGAACDIQRVAYLRNCDKLHRFWRRLFSTGTVSFKKPWKGCPDPRGSHSGSVIGNSLVVFGGYGGPGFSRRDFNDVYVRASVTFMFQNAEYTVG